MFEKEGIEAEPRQGRVRNPRTGKNEVVSEITYQEWYEARAKENPKEFDLARKKIYNESADKKQYEKFGVVRFRPILHRIHITT